MQISRLTRDGPRHGLLPRDSRCVAQRQASVALVRRRLAEMAPQFSRRRE